jgi:hypothetical protein
MAKRSKRTRGDRPRSRKRGSGVTKAKTFEGFWLGRSWVSRCARCGDICFTVADEEEHRKEPCERQKLNPLSADEKANPPGTYKAEE